MKQCLVHHYEKHYKETTVSTRSKHSLNIIFIRKILCSYVKDIKVPIFLNFYSVTEFSNTIPYNKFSQCF